ncbi:MAG: lysylphosphatidylglycerol synthase transmembrane domain-containing protein [Halanaerobiaceae bacterium]
MKTDKEKEKINIHRYMIYSLLFILISILTFFYLYNIFEKPAGFLVFTTFPPEIVLYLLLLLIIYFLLDGLRLYFVLKTLNIGLDFRHIFRLVFINIFISNITPFASGGGVAQVYYLHREGVPLGNATAATTIRTALGAAFIFISTPIIFLFNENLFSAFSGAPIFLYLLLFAVLYITFFYITIFKNKLIKKLVYSLLHFFYRRNLINRTKYRTWLKYLFQHIELFGENLVLFVKGNTHYAIATVIFTFLFLIAEFSFSILLLTGIGYEVDFVQIILMQIIVLFFMYFAPTPGATGVAEGGYSLLFSRFVYNKDLFPLIFSWRLFTKYIGIVIGMIVFYSMFVKGETENEG